MILRRMADAIREQSWFTVVLEVLIIVLGIFIGLQVDDWNKYRQDRSDEKLCLNRLHDEVLNAEKLAARLVGRRLERQQLSFDLLEVVFNDLGRHSLTADECASSSSCWATTSADAGRSPGVFDSSWQTSPRTSRSSCDRPSGSSETIRPKCSDSDEAGKGGAPLKT